MNYIVMFSYTLVSQVRPKREVSGTYPSILKVICSTSASLDVQIFLLSVGYAPDRVWPTGLTHYRGIIPQRVHST